MTSFASPVFWQTSFLVQNLSKKNQKASVAELNRLVLLYGTSVQVFLLSCLIEQVDLSNSNSNSTRHDSAAKAQVLAHLVNQLSPDISFGSTLWLAIEASTKNGGLSNPLSNPRAADEFLVNFGRVLKLSAPQQVLVGLALNETPNSVLASAALRSVATHLPQLFSPTGGTAAASALPQSAVQTLVRLLKSSELELINKQDPQELLTQLLQANDPTVLTSDLAPLLSRDLAAADSLLPLNAPDIPCSVRGEEIIGEVTVSGLLAELGFGCTLNVNSMLQVFSALAASKADSTNNDVNLTLNAKQVAEAVASMAAHESGSEPEDPTTAVALRNALHVLSGNPAPLDMTAAAAPNSWNIDVFVNAVKKVSPGLDFSAVIRALDLPMFDQCSLTMKGFELIVSVYQRATNGAPIDGSVLLNEWTHTNAQLSLLEYAVNCSPKTVTFGGHGTPMERMQTAVAGARSPPNRAWENLDVISTLLILSEKGHYISCRQILENPVKQYPELLLLGLLRAQSVSPCTLCEELFAILLPAFLRREVGTQQTSPAVFRSVWALNQRLLLRGVFDLYSRDACTLPRVVEVMRGLDNGVQSLLALQLNQGHMGLDAACYAGSFLDPPLLSLDQWLQEKGTAAVNAGGAAVLAMASDLSKFLHNKLINAHHQSTTVVGVALSTPAASRVLVLLEDLSKSLSVDLQQQVAETRALLLQSNSELANYHVSAGDVKEVANQYFESVYHGKRSVDEFIDLVQQFRSSKSEKERQIYKFMLSSLYAEYRYFQNYPTKVLRTTGEIFGKLIAKRLVDQNTYGVSLQYVIDGLRMPSEALRAPALAAAAGGDDSEDANNKDKQLFPEEKMFLFGLFALEQFRHTLAVENPAYARLVVMVPSLRNHFPAIVQSIERQLGGGDKGGGGEIMSNGGGGVTGSIADQVSNAVRGAPRRTSGGKHNDNHMNNLNLGNGDRGMHSPIPMSASALGAPPVVAAAQTPELQPLPLRGSADEDLDEVAAKLNLLIGGKTDEEMSAVRSPPEAIVDQVSFMLNNISSDNVADTCQRMMRVVPTENLTWLASYLVSSRVAGSGTFHSTYMKLLKLMKNAEFENEVRMFTLANIRKYLRSPSIMTVTGERTSVKLLGGWLGMLTLAKDKPLLHRDLDLKELLMDGYERGWMLVVLGFCTAILKQGVKSKVFAVPNPWTMGVFRFLKEIYGVPNIKINLSFDIELLSKEFAVPMDELEPTDMLAYRRHPYFANNPDFKFKDEGGAAAASAAAAKMLGGGRDGSPPNSPSWAGASHRLPPGSPLRQSMVDSSMLGGTSGMQHQQLQNHQQQQLHQQQLQQQHGGMHVHNKQNSGVDERGADDDVKRISVKLIDGREVLLPCETVIPNLAAYVHINANLQLFAQTPQLRVLVPVAVDAAIREIIQPVVERSVTIAGITSKELILKDFAMEPNEQRMLEAAHLMVSNLAGALALVTCKEPLRGAVGNHLRQLLAPVTNDQDVIDQIVQICADENLELGCLLIEKAATEKAQRDIDEHLEDAVERRKISRERDGVPHFDMSIFQQGRYPSALPEQLRPKPNGLQPQQLRVYEAFARPPRQPVVPPSQSSVGTLDGGPAGAATSVFNTQQALDKWRLCLGALDQAVQKLKISEPHVTSLNQLMNENEVMMLVYEIRAIGAKTQENCRLEASQTFAQIVFKRLYFEVQPSDALMLEVQFAVLEAVANVVPDVRQLLTEWVMRMPNEHKFNRRVAAGLIKANLMLLPDFDLFVASAMQEARGQLAVIVINFAHDIVEECVLVERSCGMHSLQNTIRMLQKVGGNASTGAAGGESSKVVRLLERLQERQAAASGGGSDAGTVVSGNKGMASQQQMLLAQKQQQQRAVDPAVLSASALPASAFQRANDPPAFRQRATRLLMSWIDIMTSSQGALKQDQFGGFMSRLNDEGVLRGEENCSNFFRITTELCVESYFNARRDPNMNPSFAYNAIDAYARLVILIVLIAERQTAKLSLLHKALDASKSVMLREFELRRGKNIETTFDQRPYFRLFLGFQRNLAELVLNPKESPGSPTGASGSGPTQEEVLAYLTPFVDLYYTHLRPSVMPTFTFSWLELIAHESFMPRLLGGSAAGAVAGGGAATTISGGNANMEQGGGVALERLLVALLDFLKPFLHNAEMPTVINRLYTGTLRLLLVLLHDFPGFLCAFHYSLCDVIPSSCVQLRNLILSAFPRSMRLPDPFTPNLNVELLPEIAQSPLVLAQYERSLRDNGMYTDMDTLITTWRPPSSGVISANVEKTIRALCNKIQSSGETKYNTGLINSVVMFVGMNAVTQAQQQGRSAHVNLAGSAAIGVVQGLLDSFDAEGRYLVLNALANQLRFPNSHTHYFSSVLLFLFGEASTLERVREQVTRVLLERLIVHRPHPWGLLITFIELIKNKKYNFWSHGFVRCAPEIDKLFESVARSCMQGQEAPTAVTAGGNGGALGNGV